jgi:hypothetical protein
MVKSIRKEIKAVVQIIRGGNFSRVGTDGLFKGMA